MSGVVVEVAMLSYPLVPRSVCPAIRLNSVLQHAT